MRLFISFVAISLSLSGAGLRLIRGRITEKSEAMISVRDDRYRLNQCRLADDAEILRGSTIADRGIIEPGAIVEAIVEEGGGNGAEDCLVRTLYVRAVRPPLNLPKAKPSQFLDNLFPRGNLVYSGTVQRLSPGDLTLRTRQGETTLFTLRDDTIFSTGGRVVTPGDLPVQTIVQLRAGRTFAGDLEVYQVTWGSILPAASRPSIH